MEFHSSFLSRLFESGSKEPKNMPEEREAPQPDGPLPVVGSPEQKPEHTLALNRGHALYKLWELYSEQAGWQPQPLLALEDENGTLLTEKDVQAELVRLRMAVNTTANARLGLIRDKTVQTPEEDGKTASVLPDLDAEATVFLTKDCTSAWLLIYPPVGAGRDIDREMLRGALAAQEISFGVSEEALDALPDAVDRYFHLVQVAKGQKPVDGEDGRIDEMYPRTQERRLKVDENNRVDYTNIDFIHNVEEQGVICWIIAPTGGEPGRTVQDRVIESKPGKAPEVPKGRNTAVSEDGLALVATVAGHVEFTGRGFSVKPVMDIPGNVDFSVGSINFLGDVRIGGDVCSGFTVRASGSVTIGGVVEACTVEAGKDLIMAKGVQGNNQAVIRAQRSVFAKYLESCCVYAKMDLETECVINCEVYCDGNVTVRTGHRSVIGGKIHAAQAIDAGIVGSRVGNRTELVMGGSPCDAFDRELLCKEIAELEQTIADTEKQPESPHKSARLSKLRVQLMMNRSKLETMQKEQAEAGDEAQEKKLCRLTAGTVYPGTVLNMDGVLYSFNEKMSPCTVTCKEGELCFS